MEENEVNSEPSVQPAEPVKQQVKPVKQPVEPVKQQMEPPSSSGGMKICVGLGVLVVLIGVIWGGMRVFGGGEGADDGYGVKGGFDNEAVDVFLEFENIRQGEIAAEEEVLSFSLRAAPEAIIDFDGDGMKVVFEANEPFLAVEEVVVLLKQDGELLAEGELDVLDANIAEVVFDIDDLEIEGDSEVVVEWDSEKVLGFDSFVSKLTTTLILEDVTSGINFLYKPGNKWLIANEISTVSLY